MRTNVRSESHREAEREEHNVGDAVDRISSIHLRERPHEEGAATFVNTQRSATV